MNIRKCYLPIALCLGLSAGAQVLDFNVSLPEGTAAGSKKLYVRPVTQNSADAAVELQAAEPLQFKGQVDATPEGLYYVYVVDSVSQTSLPVYVPASKTAESFVISVADHQPATSLTDNVNTAIGALSSRLIGNSVKLSRHITDMTPEQIRAVLSDYMSASDSIIKANDPVPENVARFMRIWAYTAASDAYSFAGYMAGRTGKKLGFSSDSVLPAAVTVLDCPIAVTFPAAGMAVMSDLSGSTVEERLASLHERYQTPEIRNMVTDMLVNSFLDSFNYQQGYDEGEARLKAIIEQYSLPETYLDTFRGRRASITGAPFPDVTLVDREGNKVDFSSFHGKFVYVDLWASWCGPCCREVPHLQKLEKEMEGSDVVFVSISIDSTKAPWLKKMDQLGMHGNQLWNEGDALPKKLNIRGIPHFLIYDREGKLLVYNAPRPSADNIRELLGSLK